MSRYKVVIADIDGTLYGDDHILSDKNRDAITKLHEADIYFGLASGRDILELSKYPTNWDIPFDFDVYIGMNGAQLRDNILHTDSNSHLMGTKDVLRIVEHMKPLDLTFSLFGIDHQQYVNRIDEDILESQIRNHFTAIPITDYSLFDTIQIMKVLFRVPIGRMDEVVSYFKEHPLDGFQGFRTHTVCYEIMKNGVSKATALERFCKTHNISPDEVIAFGDTTNDVEMLKSCFGVCLCDGTIDAKSVAKDLTDLPCCESGFGDYIEKHVL